MDPADKAENRKGERSLTEVPAQARAGGDREMPKRDATGGRPPSEKSARRG